MTSGGRAADRPTQTHHFPNALTHTDSPRLVQKFALMVQHNLHIYVLLLSIIFNWCIFLVSILNGLKSFLHPGAHLLNVP